MKHRKGYISNSSSTSFIITNKTNRFNDLISFVEENPHLIEMFKNEYYLTHNEKFTQEKLIESARHNNIIFDPKEEQVCNFGDEDGTLIGHVFDYILRNGGSSETFTWKFHEYLR